MQIDANKHWQFERLFEEFLDSYPNTPDGQFHIRTYPQVRKEARRNYKQVVDASERRDDVTELVLLKLLPYNNSKSNREKGAWVHLAPVITGDLQKWFEASGWTRPDDWPRIARAILDFVRRCFEKPPDLRAACQEFDSLPYSKGFQTGFLTPILNALLPDEFLLINNKSRQVINYLADTSHGQKLLEYPDTNATGQALVKQLAAVMRQFDTPNLRDGDLFDMFTHWLVAVKGFDFRPIRYWKIAPGEDAWNWEACRDGNFIAIGWDELGDVSGLNRKEFNAKRDESVADHNGWTKMGADQVWKFARIQEGDRVVANHGISEVLGIGRVVGPYYFVPGVRHGHRLPVEWDDVTRRQVEEHGWRRTLVNLDHGKFEEIRNARPLEPGLAKPFSRIFQDQAEAEWAFEFLAETLERLEVTGPDDERFALTLRHNGRMLRCISLDPIFLITDLASRFLTIKLTLWRIFTNGSPSPKSKLVLACMSSLKTWHTLCEASFARYTKTPLRTSRSVSSTGRRAITASTINRKLRRRYSIPRNAASYSLGDSATKRSRRLAGQMRQPLPILSIPWINGPLKRTFNRRNWLAGCEP
jgi:hypothetical protein